MLDIEAFSKWFQALGPSTIMAIFFYATGRWFNNSFWPWFQKLFEKQVVVVESLTAIVAKIDLQVTAAIANQARSMEDIDQVRRDISIIMERMSELRSERIREQIGQKNDPGRRGSSSPSGSR